MGDTRTDGRFASIDTGLMYITATRRVGSRRINSEGDAWLLEGCSYWMGPIGIRVRNGVDSAEVCMGRINFLSLYWITF